MVFLQIVGIIIAADEDEERGEGFVFGYGIFRMLATIVFTLFFTYILWSYYQHGAPPKQGPNRKNMQVDGDQQNVPPHVEEVREDVRREDPRSNAQDFRDPHPDNHEYGAADIESPEVHKEKANSIHDEYDPSAN
jgi:hypothetical protein